MTVHTSRVPRRPSGLESSRRARARAGESLRAARRRTGPVAITTPRTTNTGPGTATTNEPATTPRQHSGPTPRLPRRGLARPPRAPVPFPDGHRRAVWASRFGSGRSPRDPVERRGLPPLNPRTVGDARFFQTFERVSAAVGHRWRVPAIGSALEVGRWTSPEQEAIWPSTPPVHPACHSHEIPSSPVSPSSCTATGCNSGLYSPIVPQAGMTLAGVAFLSSLYANHRSLLRVTGRHLT